jgi:hypothetical protein
VMDSAWALESARGKFYLQKCKTLMSTSSIAEEMGQCGFLATQAQAQAQLFVERPQGLLLYEGGCEYHSRLVQL